MQHHCLLLSVLKYLSPPPNREGEGVFHYVFRRRVLLMSNPINHYHLHKLEISQGFFFSCAQVESTDKGASAPRRTAQEQQSTQNIRSPAREPLHVVSLTSENTADIETGRERGGKGTRRRALLRRCKCWSCRGVVRIRRGLFFLFESIVGDDVAMFF